MASVRELDREAGGGLPRAWTRVHLLAIVSAVGCGSSEFACRDDEACAGRPGGRCEAVGYCSFPDEACTSGRRYGEHSGVQSGLCVADDAVTSGADDGGSDTGIDDGPSTHTSGDDTTSDASTSSETTSSPTTDPSASSTTDPDDGSTGVAEPSLCEGVPIVEEHFEELPLSRLDWVSGQSEGVSTQVQDGVVNVSMDVPEGASSTYFWARSQAELPASGVAGFQVHAIPVSGPAELYVGITDSNVEYAFTSHDGNLETVVWIYPDTWFWRNSTPFDPQLHRWLRITTDAMAGVVQWQTSADGRSWETFDSEPSLAPEFDPTKAKLEFGCGAWEGPAAGDPLCSFSQAFICEN